jgi:methionyl aminopeptidase
MRPPSLRPLCRNQVRNRLWSYPRLPVPCHRPSRERILQKSLRFLYSADELDGEVGLRHAYRMGREVLDAAGKALRPGVTTDEIDCVMHEASLERSCYPSPLNYYNFPKLVCTSVNEVICHGIPDYREIQDGDVCNIDVTTYNMGGYHGDLNETFCVGNVDDDGQRLVKTSFDCFAAALALVKPGTLYRDLGTAIHKVSSANKCPSCAPNLATALAVCFIPSLMSRIITKTRPMGP